MATTTATPPQAASSSSSDPEDVRAAALAVLRLADERTEKGGTAAKHRSPLPAGGGKRASTGSVMNSNRTSSGGGNWGRRSSTPNNNNKNINIHNTTSNNSNSNNNFNLFSWGKKQMEEVKESMNQLDEKFLKLQFEQEEKFKKVYDKTASDLTGIFASPTKSNSKADTTTNTPANTPAAKKKEEAQQQQPNEFMSRFRTSFQGLTKKLVQPHQSQPPTQPVKPPSLDEQIVSELEQLHELMTLCHSLLQEKEQDLINQIDYDPDPRLPYTIKKLEAALPRMDQLMEAGIDGQFAEDDTTQICVSTYERLILTLEKCNSPLVQSNAFAIAKDLEGDDEFDETTTSDDQDNNKNNTSTVSHASSTTAAAPLAADDKSKTKENPFKQEQGPASKGAVEEELALMDGLEDDADLDIDLAAFEIGTDDDEDDDGDDHEAILNQLEQEDDEKKTDNNTSPSSDDDFIKDMFD